MKVDERAYPGFHAPVGPLPDAAFAVSAATATTPIVKALGSVPCIACQKTAPIIQRPNRPIVAPLANAAAARYRKAIPTTIRLIAQFAASPKKSRASAVTLTL